MARGGNDPLPPFTSSSFPCVSPSKRSHLQMPSPSTGALVQCYCPVPIYAPRFRPSTVGQCQPLVSRRSRVAVQGRLDSHGYRLPLARSSHLVARRKRSAAETAVPMR